MVEIILFALILFGLLWPYFIYLDVMNFSKDPNAMEEHLPGRPARRTIGRKNEDMSKAIGYVIVGYFLFNGALFGFLNLNDFLSVELFIVVSWAVFAIATFLFSPANRMMHAYANLSHIAVTHLVCAITTFLIIGGVLYAVRLELPQYLYISAIILGAMMVFSTKPATLIKKKSMNEGF